MFGLVKRIQTLERADESIFKGLGCLKDYEYDIDLIKKPDLKIHHPRRIPYAIRDDVKKELDNMVKMNVIRPVTEAIPVVSPMVIVRKNNKIRICLDPTDINKNLLRRHYPLKTVEEIAAKIQGSKYFTLLDCRRGFW